MSDASESSTAPNSDRERRPIDDTAQAALAALARALGRQAARAMWADALARGATTLQRDTSVAPPSNTSIGGPDGTH